MPAGTPMFCASASRTTGHIRSASRSRPTARAAAATTATARADEPPSPEPAGTRECVTTFNPDSTPSARRM